MPDKPRGGWTLDTLYAHLISVIDERDRRYEQRFTGQGDAARTAQDSAQRAMVKAEEASERRFAGVNEFRHALSDQTATFITRAEVESATARLADRIAELDKKATRAEGRSGGITAGWTILLGAVALVSALVTIYLALKG